jgi:hypothetical protein
VEDGGGGRGEGGTYPTPFVTSVSIQSPRQFHHDAQPVLRARVHHLDLRVVEGVPRVSHGVPGLPHAYADERIPTWCTPQIRSLCTLSQTPRRGTLWQGRGILLPGTSGVPVTFQDISSGPGKGTHVHVGFNGCQVLQVLPRMGNRTSRISKAVVCGRSLVHPHNRGNS